MTPLPSDMVTSALQRRRRALSPRIWALHRRCAARGRGGAAALRVRPASRAHAAARAARAGTHRETRRRWPASCFPCCAAARGGGESAQARADSACAHVTRGGGGAAVPRARSRLAARSELEARAAEGAPRGARTAAPGPAACWASAPRPPMRPATRGGRPPCRPAPPARSLCCSQSGLRRPAAQRRTAPCRARAQLRPAGLRCRRANATGVRTPRAAFERPPAGCRRPVAELSLANLKCAGRRGRATLHAHRRAPAAHACEPWLARSGRKSRRKRPRGAAQTRGTTKARRAAPCFAGKATAAAQCVDDACLQRQPAAAAAAAPPARRAASRPRGKPKGTRRRPSRRPLAPRAAYPSACHRRRPTRRGSARQQGRNQRKQHTAHDGRTPAFWQHIWLRIAPCFRVAERRLRLPGTAAAPGGLAARSAGGSRWREP